MNNQRILIGSIKVNTNQFVAIKRDFEVPPFCGRKTLSCKLHKSQKLQKNR